jgi:hypothetical protein
MCCSASSSASAVEVGILARRSASCCPSDSSRIWIATSAGTLALSIVTAARSSAVKRFAVSGRSPPPASDSNRRPVYGRPGGGVSSKYRLRSRTVVSSSSSRCSRTTSMASVMLRPPYSRTGR